MSSGPQRPVTLDNCADEPIHIPGSVQPHGALLALDGAGGLQAWSENAAGLLGCTPAGGLALAQLGLPPEVVQAALELLAESRELGGHPCACEVHLAGAAFDLIAHVHLERSLLEFESRGADDDVTGFALRAHRSIERLKRASALQPLMERLVTEVRALTGFDRVMAYRFRHDKSGDVVAEARDEALAPYLGMRYPASDIPAQARRLYTLNTLRLIPDIGYRPVPLLGHPASQPLDLTHAVLRSVSPIHVEYLQNMKVAASMSVSIVINGELWGLIACHHMQPRHVPFSVRMSCDVMAQVVSSTVQALEARDTASRMAQGTAVFGPMLTEATHADDLPATLHRHAPALMSLLCADALVIAQQSRVLLTGPVTEAQAAAIVTAVPGAEEGLAAVSDVEQWPPEVRSSLQGFTGALSLSYDPLTASKVIALRLEQIETVRWAGTPDKNVVEGPLGPRLTPRGSFAEWCETVRGRSVPWSADQLLLGQQLLHELQRVSLARHADTEAARRNLLAMLGHDLRDPLQAIRMVAHSLKKNDGPSTASLGNRLDSTSGRMARLITQVLEFSRAETGGSLSAERRAVDLAALAEDLAEESHVGHPGTQIELDLQRPAWLHADIGRLSQVVSNLLGNARHYGELNKPIVLGVKTEGQEVVLTVRNQASPIEPALVPTLFEAYKRSNTGYRNRTGLGLGLYIASHIVSEHGGQLVYRYEAPHVVFEARLPVAAAGA